MFKFIQQNLRSGLIVSLCSRSMGGKIIQAGLSKAFNGLGADAKKITPEVFSHDALLLWNGKEYCIGDSKPMHARQTALIEYERRMNEGEYYNVRVFEVAGLVAHKEHGASLYWLENVDKTWYDFWAYPRLIAKAIFGDWLSNEAGNPSAYWCTEGVASAFRIGAGVDVYAKTNPTPLTTIKRAMSGILHDITPFIIATV